jgi:hypothetical protein
MSKPVWRVPWTEVRHGTEYEAGDEEYKREWANILLGGECLDLWAEVMADIDPSERYAQGEAMIDDVLIALDMIGWKVVAKDQPECGFPITGRQDEFVPDWCNRSFLSQ